MGNCLSAVVQVLEVVNEDAKKQEQQQQQQSYAAATASSNNDNNQQQAVATPSSYAAAATGTTSSTTTTTTTTSSSSSSSSLSPYYTSLPSNAEQVQVRNVYDGDTLTLTDQRRVRFLGIDTPEIKEKQPYAQEAKAYTKDKIDNSNNNIWISFENGQNKEDHYGRLLAYVWIKDENGYLCINEGIIAAGLASAYIPNSNTKLHNWDKMIKLQNTARNAKRGMWKDFTDITVVKTTNGSAYHIRTCTHLQKSYNIIELKASEATAQGLHPCRTCMS